MFDRLDRAAGRVADRVMGEAVEVLPRITLPKRPASADPDRSVVGLTARFTLEAQDGDLEGQRRGTDLGGFTRLAGQVAILTIEASEAAKLTYEIVAGDLVALRAPSRASHPRYCVLNAPRSDLGILTLHLSREIGA
jgi:hypothetical protein